MFYLGNFIKINFINIVRLNINHRVLKEGTKNTENAIIKKWNKYHFVNFV